MKKIIWISRAFLLLGILSFTTLSGFSMSDKNVEIKIKTSAVCDMCKDKIEQGLGYEKGIKNAILDVDTKIVTVNYNPAKITPDQIRTAISKLGYNADKVLADKTAFGKLPKCCQNGSSKD